MTRLTIHLEEPMFIEREQTNIGTKENVVLKPKKKSVSKTLYHLEIFLKTKQEELSQMFANNMELLNGKKVREKV